MRNFPCSGGLVVLATALVISVATAQEVPNFQCRFTEKPGPYSVGLKVIEQYDRSRVFHSTIDGTGKSATVDGFRPLQTLVWYPAEASLAAISTRQSSSSRLHYLALLEQKTRALDRAAPLVGWQLPDGFLTLRRLLEARLF